MKTDREIKFFVRFTLYYQDGDTIERDADFCVRFLAENLKIYEMRASHLTSQTQKWANPKPLHKQKEQE